MDAEGTISRPAGTAGHSGGAQGDPSLESTLFSHWDARIVPYDRERFPFDTWIRDEVRRLGYPIDELNRLHEVVPEEETYGLSKRLCAATYRPEFRRMVRDFVVDEVAPAGALVAPLAVQRFLNVRIMLPARPQAVFPFHTGLLYGHGPASRSLWMPLTEVSAPEDHSASMQIIGLERSRALVAHAAANRLSIQDMNEIFGRESWPLAAGPGRVVFFNQENIHGNFVNVSGKTRVSIDFRVAEARFGDRLARKIPGGYFEILPDDPRGWGEPSPAPESNGKSHIIYLNNSTPSTVHVPVHLQRYMVDDYCKKSSLHYTFELFELETMEHLPTLLHIVENLKCNVLLYSVFALPLDATFRARIIETALRNGLVLHFANEGTLIADEADHERVERLLDFAKYGERAEG